MTKILDLLRKIFAFIKNLFSAGKKMTDNGNEEVIEQPKPNLLKPITHTRYISIYCIADLLDGKVPIRTVYGNTIYSISKYSKSRLDMEGTGRLPNGQVVNVATKIGGDMRYVVMGNSSPFGVGIKGKALEPWVSLAHEYTQLTEYDLYGRTIVIPSMRGFDTGTGIIHTGIFCVHDTGGGLRKCPYSKGLWRTGAVQKIYGQFDMFVGDETVYKRLMPTWKDYKEVIVMPRDVKSNKSIQETLNLLLDSGLDVDGVIGPKTESAIKVLQSKSGLEETGKWDKKTREFAEASLNNW